MKKSSFAAAAEELMHFRWTNSNFFYLDQDLGNIVPFRSYVYLISNDDSRKINLCHNLINNWKVFSIKFLTV